MHSDEIYWYFVENIDKYEDAILAKGDENALQVLLLAFDVAMPKRTNFFLEQLIHENEGHRKWAAYALRKIDSREARKAVWHIRQSHEFASHKDTEAFCKMLDDIFGWDSRSQR